MRRLFILLLLMSIVLLASAGIVVSNYYRAPGPLDSDKVVIIPSNTGIQAMSRLLAEEGVVDHPFLFSLLARWWAMNHTLKAGEYLFTTQSSPRDILQELERGKSIIRKVTLPEGFTVKQLFALLEEAEGMEGEVPETVREGSVMPDTYHYHFGDSVESVVERMQRAMRLYINEQWEQRADNLPLNTPEEAIILASIVEKETGVHDERARIAGVFVNRLRRGMRLQSDPTIIYALTDGTYALERRLLRKDWELDSPYNTYRIDGLPPGPISNPGREAIDAVLHPQSTKELFFVADGDGGHLFATTLKQHNRNVARLQRIRRKARSQR